MASSNVDLEKLMAWTPAEKIVSWTRRDTILYALGVGAHNDLCFTYEQSPQFAALPTIWCSMMFKGDSNDVIDFNKTAGKYPGLTFNPAQILHGEEFLELYGNAPTHGTFVQKGKVLAFLDKGSGGVLLMEYTLHPKDRPNGPPVARLVRSTFIRGLGGHGPKKLANDPRPAPPAKPSRAPDAVLVVPTERHQAMIYRLSGDFNPLHADPAVAQTVGFERPILHGLCSFGISVYAVVKSFPEVVVKSVQTRFSSPVLPGQRLEVKMWREPGWILFETAVEGKAVLSGGAVQIGNTSKL